MTIYIESGTIVREKEEYMRAKKTYKIYGVLSKLVGFIGIALGTGLIVFGIMNPSLAIVIPSIVGGFLLGVAGITGSVVLEEKEKKAKGTKHHNHKSSYTIESLENDQQNSIENTHNVNTNSTVFNKEVNKDNGMEL